MFPRYIVCLMILLADGFNAKRNMKNLWEYQPYSENDSSLTIIVRRKFFFALVCFPVSWNVLSLYLLSFSKDFCCMQCVWVENDGWELVGHLTWRINLCSISGCFDMNLMHMLHECYWRNNTVKLRFLKCSHLLCYYYSDKISCGFTHNLIAGLQFSQSIICNNSIPLSGTQ